MNSFKHLNFPQKVYLSGADCFHLMLEINAKKFRIGNNVIRIVFEFDNEKQVSPLIENIKKSPIIYWMCNISLVQRFFFQKPYWKFNDQNHQIEIKEHFSEIERDIPASILNRNISLESEQLVEFDLVRHVSGKINFILSWHHILMDGRGSGLLLKHLNDADPIDQKGLSEFFPSIEKSVSLLQQIKNMFEVKRFIETSSKAPISTVMSNKKIGNNDFKIKTLHFTAEESNLIDANAQNNGARFGANLFLIACCSHLVHRINQKRNATGTIWLPVPYDGRKRGGNGPVITNCISFLFYRLMASDLVSVKSTVAAISNQMAEQLKIEMPKKYNSLLNSMRHIPLSLYHFLTTRSSKGVVSSFLYSSAGENMWDMNTLLSKPVADILVIPPFIYPPGLTFSFLRYNGALKMNIVYSERSIDPNELTLIEKQIKELLLGNN